MPKIRRPAPEPEQEELPRDAESEYPLICRVIYDRYLVETLCDETLASLRGDAVFHYCVENLPRLILAEDDPSVRINYENNVYADIA